MLLYELQLLIESVLFVVISEELSGVSEERCMFLNIKYQCELTVDAYFVKKNKRCPFQHFMPKGCTR